MSDKQIHNRYDHLCFQKRWQLGEEHWFLLGESSALIRAIKNTAIRPDFRRELYKVSLIKGAVATTAIEGNTLTEEQVRALEEGRAELPESREYLQTEVENVIAALNSVLRQVIDNRDVLITPELIREYHRMIGKNIKTTIDSGGVDIPILTDDYLTMLPNYDLIERNVMPYGYKTVDNFHSELLLLKIKK